MDKFTEFVLEHEGDEVEALVLQKGRWPDIDVAKAADTIAGRRRMRLKAPSWWKCAEVVYPSRLCVEQCSSEVASEIKAEIITALWYEEELLARPKIADLTGGLGVDSWAFSKVAEKVLYVERDKVLAETAKHNFAVLGCNNIEVLNAEVGADGFSNDGWEALRKFAPDVIYLDPSRRSEGGEKVLKLEDCRPNILELRDKLLEIAELVVVKLSPMADIDEVVRQLGPTCLRTDVISVDGECKEMLVTMERDYDDKCMIIADCGGLEASAFFRSDEAAAVPHYLSLTSPKNPSNSQIKNSNPSLSTRKKSCFPESSTNSITDILSDTKKSKTCDTETFASLTGKILLEPDKALMKAAPFKLLSEVFGLVKLDVSTHYYIDGDSFRDHEINRDEKISGLFRRFRILRVEPLNKKTLQTISRDYPNADVTARNIPLTTDELRKRLAVSSSKHDNHPSKNNNEPLGHPSDSIHIFALRVAGENLLFVTEKL